MRGYFDFGRVDLLCIHFVYADEVDLEWVATLPHRARDLDISVVYIDALEIANSPIDLCNLIGDRLGLENAPYSDSAWGPFYDDLIGLSYKTKGLVIVVDHARCLMADREKELTKLIEAAQIQQHHWYEQGKPFDLYLQMEDVGGLKMALGGILSG